MPLLPPGCCCETPATGKINGTECFKAIEVCDAKIKNICGTEDIQTNNITTTNITTNTMTVSQLLTGKIYTGIQMSISPQTIGCVDCPSVGSAIYTGLEAPLGDKLMFVSPGSAVYTLITPPLTGTGTLTAGSNSLTLDASNATGLIHADTRTVVNITSSNTAAAINLVITKIANTDSYIPGVNNQGNGSITITAYPALGGGDIVGIEWYIDGRLELGV